MIQLSLYNDDALCKLCQYREYVYINVFGKLKQVIIITNDIMVVGYKPDYSDHNQAFTSLLQTTQKFNAKINL